MKIIPLAVASFLSFAIENAVGQRGTTTLLRGATDPSLALDESRRAAAELLVDTVESIGESTCMKIDDEDACNGSVDADGIDCVWCKCSAIPSECLNVEQSKQAPPGVFDCTTPSSPNSDSFASQDMEDVVATDARGYDPKMFTYTLRDDTVDGELCDPNSKSLAGYIDITGSKYDADGQNKHLFYWFFEKRGKSALQGDDEDKIQDPKDIPLVLWLTGGPGCSSTLALLFENGPCKVSEDGHSTSINPYSWTESAHVLWLDQPAGVGYSYGTADDYNEEMISEDTYYFLQEFFKEHPEYSENPLSIVGESYGGHYAPAVAHKVWTYNKNPNPSMIHINLAKLGVGNGLTNPMEQYQHYPEMAVNNSHGIKVVSDEVYINMKNAVPGCVTLIKKCNQGDSFINKLACQSAFVACNLAETSPFQMTGLNQYDIREKCKHPPLCYEFSYIDTFLNLESTKNALHVSTLKKKWASCNMGINLKFHSDWMHDFSPYVADLLDDGIDVLIYAGDVDYVCNYIGNRAWTLGLDWKHKDEFNAAEDREWGGDESGSAGLAKTSNGFTFLQVYDAGHMVPYDKPKVALEMITNFLNGGDF